MHDGEQTHGSQPETDNDQDGEVTPSSIVNDLIIRAKDLLSELESLRTRLRTLRQEGSVEIAHFRGTVQSELSMLERLAGRAESQATHHVARSSNLPFLETVWSVAKKSRDLVALQKRVFLNAGLQSLAQDSREVNQGMGLKRRAKGCKENAVIADVIGDGGRTWTKVSLVTNTRLLFDLAKQGWDSGGSGDDGDGPVFSPDNESDDDRDVPLLRTAKELTRAARMFRIRTKFPSVRLILPRIQRNETPAIDAVLGDCTAAGVAVFCGEDLEPAPDIAIAMTSMAQDALTAFSYTLNIDCTILLALVSEFSHAKVSKEPWFHKALRRQVEIEDNENLLPSLLYPAMKDHELVCTSEAASRMREIVNTIGTPSEKVRTAILLGDDSSMSQQELVKQMQEWSAYIVPPYWRLPIKTVDQDEGGCQSHLPPEAAIVSESMTAINKSVFLYGWSMDRTTITSNRTVVKQVERDLEQFVDLADSVWPRIWLCPTARSLVGKEKRGAKKSAQTLPDPLRREEQRRNGLDVLSVREGHEVEDLRPNGYNCEEVIAAKEASQR